MGSHQFPRPSQRERARVRVPLLFVWIYLCFVSRRVQIASRASLKDINQTIGRLCRSCGFCCNGVFFSSVVLTEEDRLLKKVQLRYRSLSQIPSEDGQDSELFPQNDEEQVWLLEQPCMFHKKNRCVEYSRRPEPCRGYECRLVRGIRGKSISVESAQEILARAVELYNQLDRKLEGELRDRSFWVNVRRLANEGDPLDPSLSKMAGIDDEMIHSLEEFAVILDKYFQAAPTGVI